MKHKVYWIKSRIIYLRVGSRAWSKAREENTDMTTLRTNLILVCPSSLTRDFSEAYFGLGNQFGDSACQLHNLVWSAKVDLGPSSPTEPRQQLPDAVFQNQIFSVTGTSAPAASGQLYLRCSWSCIFSLLPVSFSTSHFRPPWSCFGLAGTQHRAECSTAKFHSLIFTHAPTCFYFIEVASLKAWHFHYHCSTL